MGQIFRELCSRTREEFHVCSGGNRGCVGGGDGKVRGQLGIGGFGGTGSAGPDLFGMDLQVVVEVIEILVVVELVLIEEMVVIQKRVVVQEVMLVEEMVLVQQIIRVILQ